MVKVIVVVVAGAAAVAAAVTAFPDLQRYLRMRRM